MAMTNAERQKKFRVKQKTITDQARAVELDRKRKELMRFIETMPEREMLKLYRETVELQKIFDEINEHICDMDIDGLLEDIAS